MKGDNRSQILRMLQERRGELIYDLKRHRTKEFDMAAELVRTDKAIAEIEGERLNAGINDD